MVLLDVLFYTFCVVVFFQVIIYLCFYGKFAFYKQNQKPLKQSFPPVSVIVYAKNQANELQANLPDIISQNYPDFEIILVNNHSSDCTVNVMEQFKQHNQAIKIVNVKNIEAFWASKKYALTLGIKAATHDYLLFTESNFKPLTKSWIREMSTKFGTKKDIVIGFKTYPKNQTLFNKFLRCDNIIDILTTFSFTKSGLPFKGDNSNLAYTKKAFFKANGFTNHIKLYYGEASLFINQVATTKNTALCINPIGFTQQQTPINFVNWKQNKQLLLKTAMHFNFLNKSLLILLHITHVLFWLLASILFVVGYYWYLVLALFLFRISIQLIIFGISAKKLNQSDIVIFLPILEVFLLLVQITIFISQLTATRNHWK